MDRLRHLLPAALSAGALLIAATVCLKVSYAGIEDDGALASLWNRSPQDRHGNGAPDLIDRSDSEPDVRSWMSLSGNPDEQVEEQKEASEAPERAEEARESSEEMREEYGSSTRSTRFSEAVLRAHLEVIQGREPPGGVAPDPCVYRIALPPASGEKPARRVEVRLTRKESDGRLGETRALAEVTSPATCTTEGGFFIDNQRAPAKLSLCPASCSWARSAVYGLSADVLLNAP
jgi:hypothetical protein